MDQFMKAHDYPRKFLEVRGMKLSKENVKKWKINGRDTTGYLWKFVKHLYHIWKLDEVVRSCACKVVAPSSNPSKAMRFPFIKASKFDSNFRYYWVVDGICDNCSSPAQLATLTKSLSFDLKSYDPEIERTLRLLRAHQQEEMAGEPLRPLKEYFTPSNYDSPSSTCLPEIGANQFEIKPSIIQMLPSFYGLSSENPYKHIDEFLEVCSTFKLPNVSEDGCYKIAFVPFFSER
ncbi:uncharacterized protein G2W53_033180 [Senna tora]|uniref:Uncharacterized protein n=1 Tax=Senna tora TaxID=362788 RepID=A0A834T935_9FABA|nr:uncharacterized protein G2W53_033180 [Senna tora]